MAEGIVRGFVVATSCNTVEAFVERYWSRFGSNWIFVSVIESRVIGRECAFAILLTNRQPVLAGVCEVFEVFPDANNQFHRTGMVLRIRKLGLESERVFEMLVKRASGRSGSRLARGSGAPLQELEASQSALADVDYDTIPLDIDDAIPIEINDDAMP